MTTAGALVLHSAVERLASHRRIGLVVPPANPVAEPETAHLLGGNYAIHTTRFAVSHEPLRARLEAYNRTIPDMIASFGGLGLDALLVACSGSRYLLGPDLDRDACAALTACYGMPVASVTLATQQVLQRLGVRDLVLVSPYAEWLTELARRFWRRAGFRVRVVAIQTASHTYAPYEVAAADLIAQVERAHLPDDAALLCTGTGMSTLPALPALGAGNNRLLLTSNVCGSAYRSADLRTWEFRNHVL
ncbi:hypothetical protein, partial [Nonomuraea sp. NPDC049695]|uniref:maleate cis-trans isomerase family protein n=1 Tax=Nonomuraea sp. NPDC049695 TaxID=3154734 RepID=UPI00343EEBC3